MKKQKICSKETYKVVCNSCHALNKKPNAIQISEQLFDFFLEHFDKGDTFSLKADDQIIMILEAVSNADVDTRKDDEWEDEDE